MVLQIISENKLYLISRQWSISVTIKTSENFWFSDIFKRLENWNIAVQWANAIFFHLPSRHLNVQS